MQMLNIHRSQIYVTMTIGKGESLIGSKRVKKNRPD